MKGFTFVKELVKTKNKQVIHVYLDCVHYKKVTKIAANSKKKNGSGSKLEHKQITASFLLSSALKSSLDAGRSGARTLSTTMPQILIPSNTINTETKSLVR